jgi:hypothetical protein
VDILQDVVKSINETLNRSLDGRTAASVTRENEDEMRLDAYLARSKSNKSKTVKTKTTSVKTAVQIRSGG